MNENQEKQKNVQIEGQKIIEIVENQPVQEEPVDEVNALPEAHKLIQEVDSRIIFNALGDEEPISLAVFLLKLPQKQAAKLLSHFPKAKQSSIARAISKTEIMSSSEAEDIYNRIVKKIYDASKNTTVFGDGASNLAGILKHMDIENQAEILKELSADDPATVKKIRDELFSFDDIVELDDDAIRTILHVMDNNAMGLALKTANEEIKQRFFDCMTDEQIEQVQEAIENISIDQIHLADSAREAIVSTVQNFSEKGMLKIRKKE